MSKVGSLVPANQIRLSLSDPAQFQAQFCGLCQAVVRERPTEGTLKQQWDGGGPHVLGRVSLSTSVLLIPLLVCNIKARYEFEKQLLSKHKLFDTTIQKVQETSC